MSQTEPADTNPQINDVTVTPPSLARWFQAFALRVTSLETSITLVQKNTLVQKPENHRGKLAGVACFRIGVSALLLFGGLLLPVTRASEGTAERPSNSPPAGVTTDKNSETPKKPAAPNLPPEKYRDVDDAAKLLVWLVIACGLGGLVMLGVIVLGARRMRRLTRSQMLKSKYDELEFLRLKHRRESDGLTASEPPKTEIR